jgi:hypothetical protein
MTETVGYRRPPKEHQFKPGQSGNPKGRPKRQREDLAKTFRKVANQTITVPTEEGAVRMLRWEALIRQLMLLALGDKPHLASLLFSLRDAFGYSSTLTLYFSEVDMKL